MRLRVFHRTAYGYPSPVTDSHNEVRLMPLTDADQTCLDFQLTVRPSTPVYHYAEPGGTVHHFGIRAPHSELEITAEAHVETRLTNPFATLDLVGDDGTFYQSEELRQEFAEYLSPTRYVQEEPGIASLAQAVRPEAGPSVASYLIAATHLVHDTLEYVPGATDVQTTLAEVLRERRGVCQDFAHVMLALCRHRGIPSRYVSGYVYATSGKSLRADQATHAWVECLLPNRQWRGFDPTNNLLVNDQYIKIHLGRDYADVPPTRGVFRGPATNALQVQVQVSAEGA